MILDIAHCLETVKLDFSFEKTCLVARKNVLREARKFCSIFDNIFNTLV